MEPPSRMNTAFLPKPVSSALIAFWKIGWEYEATQGLAVLRTSNWAVTVFGSNFRMCLSTCFAIFAGSWFGTKRVENFAQAFDGITVLAPSSMYPPQIPFISSVGLVQSRSTIV